MVRRGGASNGVINGAEWHASAKQPAQGQPALRKRPVGELVVERRRQWSPEHKAVVLAEVEAEGGQVSVVARRHGVSTSLLYNRRSAWKAAALAARATAARPAGFGSLGG